MKARPCLREEEVLAAERAETWPPGLAEHAASCTTCRETRLVHGALTTLAARTPDADEGPPPADLVFLRSRIFGEAQRARTRAEAASGPIRIAEGAAALATLGAGAALVAAGAAGPAVDRPLVLLLQVPAFLFVSGWLAARLLAGRS
jgi:hypothetical protein